MALPVGDAEVHASGGPLFRTAVTGPDRETILEGANRPLLVVRPVAGNAVSVGDAEVHASGGPLFRIAFARQHRERVFEGGDGHLPVAGPVAVVPLRVGKAEVRASGGPVGIFFGRLFPRGRASAICLWFK